MSIRSFIAIPINKPLADTLGDLSAKMAYQDKSHAIRWVDQANYHITLAFLGDQEQRVLEDLAERLDEVLPDNSFELSLKHLSPFPEGRPKLIAAMADKNIELFELQRQVISVINACSISIEKRRFIPHVTLGRYRHKKNQFAGTMPTSLDLLDEITEVTIFESVLTPTGAEYDALFRFPLDEFNY